MSSYGEHLKVGPPAEWIEPEHDPDLKRCVHCGYVLEARDQELDSPPAEVCRYCRVQFGTRRGMGKMLAARCPACEDRRGHTDDDKRICNERIQHAGSPARGNG